MRKAFEGIYSHDRDWNALADLVLWLEFRGLSGLSKFFEAETLMQTSSKPSCVKSNNGYVLDGKGNSLLSFSHLAADIAIARALQDGQCVMQIKETVHSDVIAASVDSCARNGLAAAAWWPGEKDWSYIAFQESNEPAPNLYRISLPQGHKSYNHVTLIASERLAYIETSFPEWFAFKKGTQTLSNEISNRYLDHLDNGFTLSRIDYDRLCGCADKILVESTEQSRQGAGE